MGDWIAHNAELRIWHTGGFALLGKPAQAELTWQSRYVWS